jgi:chromosome segregation ATPase
MTIKEIIAKIAKGEKATDEELEFLGKAIPPEEADSKAAAARRKADEDAKALKAEIEALKAEKQAAEEERRKKDEEGQTATQKMEKRLADLSKKFADLEAQKAESDKAAAALRRSQDIERIREKAGISFREGIDPAITSEAFAGAFAKVEDLTDSAAVEAAVKAFREANTGMILDKGHGSGLPGKPAVDLGGENPYSRKSYNLTKIIELESKDPAKASELKAAANKEQ